MFIDFKNNDFFTKGENITITNKNLGTTTTMPKARFNKHVNGMLGATFIGALAYGFVIGAVYGTGHKLAETVEKVRKANKPRSKKQDRSGNGIFSHIFRR